MQKAGYQTAIIGNGTQRKPTGFDHWEVLPGRVVTTTPTSLLRMAAIVKPATSVK